MMQGMEWIAGILAAVLASLIAAGVVGVWKLSNGMSALQATVASWTVTFNTKFEQLLVTTKEHSNRIGTLEGKIGIHDYQIQHLSKEDKSDTGSGYEYR